MRLHGHMALNYGDHRTAALSVHIELRPYRPHVGVVGGDYEWTSGVLCHSEERLSFDEFDVALMFGEADADFGLRVKLQRRPVFKADGSLLADDSRVGAALNVDPRAGDYGKEHRGRDSEEPDSPAGDPLTHREGRESVRDLCCVGTPLLLD